MKREMLQKVNEAVANFRKVADQQMAETTKRAIRENMTITSQLKKMSTKTMELIQENEELTEKVSKLKKFNQLLTESEKELAKKNNSSQKVVKMLVEKLKESDQMLELAFDDPLKQLDQQETEPQREYLTDEMIQVNYNINGRK
jgi:galactokinase